MQSFGSWQRFVQGPPLCYVGLRTGFARSNCGSIGVFAQLKSERDPILLTRLCVQAAFSKLEQSVRGVTPVLELYKDHVSLLGRS